MRKAILIIIVVTCSLLIVSLGLISQEVPENEIQFNINTYFDNFNVNVITRRSP